MQPTSPAPTDEATAIAREIDAALAKRSTSGALAYVLLLTVFFIATPAFTTHRTAALAELAWMAVLVAIRFALARAFATTYPQTPRRWARQFRVVTLALGLSWGVAGALWARAMGHGFDTMIVVISTAGVAAGGMSSLGPSARLAGAYVGCLLVPSLVSFAFAGDGSREVIGLAAVFTLYGGFLVIESRRVHAAFVLAVRRTHLLAARADELAEGTRRMRELLDAVGQGFLRVGLDGTMAAERSAILERWLGPSHGDEPVWAYLARRAPTAARWLELGLEALREDALPAELIVDQLPPRLRVDDRHLAIEYRLTRDADRVTSVLLILSDVTSEVERLRSEEEQRELLRVFELVQADRRGVREFMAEADRLAADIAGGADVAPAELLRWIHTLKGNAALFGLHGLARRCHDVETTVAASGEPVSPTDRARLAEAWQDASRRIAPLVGDDTRAVDVTRDEYQALVAAVAAEAPHAALAERLRRWELEPSARRLCRLAEQARELARRLGKAELDVVIEPNDLRLPPDRLGGFWSAFAHVVRNAVDHGIEPAADRVARGKPAGGTLTVRTFVEDAEFVVSLEDDGRGIDWERVAVSARAHGLASSTPAELEAALYADGVSTAEVATEVSGRGVGMASVRAEVLRLGGRLALASERWRGTRWMVRFPRSILAA